MSLMTLLVAMLSQGVTQAGTSPLVTPLVVTAIPGAGPSFFVECTNTTDHVVPSGDLSWPLRLDALRLDGVSLREVGGAVGPGLTMDVRPGGVWRGIIELRQTQGGGSPTVAFGALVRAPFLVPVVEG